MQVSRRETMRTIQTLPCTADPSALSAIPAGFFLLRAWHDLRRGMVWRSGSSVERTPLSTADSSLQLAAVLSS
jgi:hypothetical protein